jgi:hypothetical protein
MFAKLSWQRIGLAILLITFFIGAVFLHNNFTRQVPGGTDSTPRWVGTQAWAFEGLNPYSEEVTARAQQMVYGRLAKPGEDKQKFAYPFYVIFYYLPLIWLDYNLARAIAMVILEGALISLTVLSLRTYRWSPPPWLAALTIAWAVLFYHGARTILLGQFAGISAVLIALSIWAIKERRDVLAGCALALASPKPQMLFLLIPLVGLWGLTARRWKITAAIAVTMSILTGLSFLFLPSWLSEMQAQLSDYTTYTHIGSPINILTTLVFPFLGAPVEWILNGILVAWLAWEWWQVRFSDTGKFDWVVALTLLVTNLVVVRTATTNYVMMLPALFYLLAAFSRTKGKRANLWIALIEIGLFIGLWMLFLFTVQGAEEQWPVYLPLPLGLLVALLVFRPKGSARPAQPLEQPG